MKDHPISPPLLAHMNPLRNPKITTMPELDNQLKTNLGWKVNNSSSRWYSQALLYRKLRNVSKCNHRFLLTLPEMCLEYPKPRYMLHTIHHQWWYQCWPLSWHLSMPHSQRGSRGLGCPEQGMMSGECRATRVGCRWCVAVRRVMWKAMVVEDGKSCGQGLLHLHRTWNYN